LFEHLLNYGSGCSTCYHVRMVGARIGLAQQGQSGMGQVDVVQLVDFVLVVVEGECRNGAPVETTGHQQGDPQALFE
jgi:hypothetical protein